MKAVRFRAALVTLVLGTLLAADAAYGADVPGWLREAAGAAASPPRKGVVAEVLLAERTVTYDPSGRSTATERRVVRVLDRAGREEARAVVPYLTDTTKISDLKGWILQPGGEVRELGKKETVDVAAAANDVYNEARVRALVGGDLVEPGGVFGAEWTVDDRSVFSQFDWRFQGRQPVRLSRLTLVLPAGFTHEAVAFNRSEGLPKTEIAGGVRWELRDLPALLTEDEAPPLTRLSPRLAVSVFAPPSAREAGPAFRSWADVSTWFHTLSIPSADSSASLTQRARDLTRDARTPFEKTAAVGRYVQGLNYVSIQTGLGRGGGYRPHAASLVLEKGYGDCKDKANLMKTLLREVGVASDLVSVYLGDASYVRDEWPSPRQFNHAILAVRLPEESGAPSTTVAPAVARHAALGLLLFVDPTAQHTPVGELPESLQGSRGLIELKEGGALL
ncbi:MAG: DUF3857 domain-containing transglutaminase family protein, partial [Acidobacteria bacterium]|nr:DUF3857 domain-containing transglutaminase family protein [Acidobacteriota bacterium]